MIDWLIGSLSSWCSFLPSFLFFSSKFELFCFLCIFFDGMADSGNPFLQDFYNKGPTSQADVDAILNDLQEVKKNRAINQHDALYISFQCLSPQYVFVFCVFLHCRAMYRTLIFPRYPLYRHWRVFSTRTMGREWNRSSIRLASIIPPRHTLPVWRTRLLPRLMWSAVRQPLKNARIAWKSAIAWLSWLNFARCPLIPLSRYCSQSIDCPIDWLIDWRIRWNCSIEWDWLIDWNWLIDPSIYLSIEWLIDWLIDWYSGRISENWLFSFVFPGEPVEIWKSNRDFGGIADRCWNFYGIRPHIRYRNWKKWFFPTYFSHHVLFFSLLDLTQKLICRCSPPTNDIGPVSAIDANRDERRILVGFAKGLVSFSTRPFFHRICLLDWWSCWLFLIIYP